MSAIWFLLLLLQHSQFHSLTQTASLSSLANNAAVTFPQATSITTATSSLLTPGNQISVFFTNPGGPIPAAELRQTLSVASADVQTYLPHSADEPIAGNSFEENISFPDTGESVSISVYAYGVGLSWRQLSHTLAILRSHVLGLGPGHPEPHYQQLEFYVQLAAGIEVAHGVVGFVAAGVGKAVAKRGLISTSLLQLPHGNFSSSLGGGALTLPILFRIPKTNIDLNITSLGVPIPESTILTTIDLAFGYVIMEHFDIDALIPAGRPYSFNATFGTKPQEFDAEIAIGAYPSKEISWGLLCILYFGLRDFMNERKHFNALGFVVIDGDLGNIGFGDVFYRHVAGTASAKRLVRGRGSYRARAAI